MLKLLANRSLGRSIAWTALSAFWVLLYATDPSYAHGTAGAVVDNPTRCVRFTYDDGEPMSYAKVTVQAPGAELTFQSAATDRNGVICFAPDQNGAWSVTAGDGMGHQQRMVVDVAPAPVADAPRAPAESVVAPKDRLGRVLAGLGIIFGLAGIVATYRARTGRH